MFGGKSGFSSTLGDEMFANFLAASSTPTRRSPKTLNNQDEKPLLNSRKAIKDPILDEFDSKPGKPVVVKTTTSLAQKQAESNTRLRKTTSDITDAQFDDILADILDRSNDHSNRTKTTENNRGVSRPITPEEEKPHQDILNDLGELNDNELFTGYDPSARSTRSRRSMTMTNIDTNNTKQTRPQTTQGISSTTNVDDIGEFNITVSRRRPPRNQSQGTPERPFTSPGKFEETTPLSTKINFPKIPEDDIPPSENTPSNSTETRPIRGLANPDFQNAKTRTPSPMPVIADKTSEDTTFREAGSPSRIRPGISRQQSLISPAKQGGPFDNTVNTVIINESPTLIRGTSIPSWQAESQFWTAGKKEIQPEAHKVSSVTEDYYRNQIREIEEQSKKRVKDAEEYYEKRYESLKSALIDEKTKWEELQAKEIEMLKKEREDIKKSMQEIIDKERDRAKEIYKSEMDSKEKMYKFELEKQRLVFEEQYQNLKTQFESQSRLNLLADEIRVSSTKITVLSDQMELNKNLELKDRESKIQDKERELIERERYLTHERELVNLEKNRIAKSKELAEKKEAESLKSLEKEREWLKSEYLRLSTLQESMNNFEGLKKAELEKEARRIEEAKAYFEKEKLQFSAQIRERNHELEIKRQMVEENQKNVSDVMLKGDSEIRTKLREIEELKMLLLQERADFAKKAKSLDERERDIKLRNDAVNKRMVDLDRVSQELEARRKELLTAGPSNPPTQKYTNEELVALFTKENEKLGTESMYSSVKQSPIKEREETNPYYTPFSISKDHSPAPVKSILKTSNSQKTLGHAGRLDSLISENTVFDSSMHLRPTSNTENQRMSRNMSTSAIKYNPRLSESPNPSEITQRTTAKPREKVRVGDFNMFNMQDYMAGLKNLEKRRDDVVRYINYENVGLMKDKVTGETTKLNVLSMSQNAKKI